MPNSMNEYGKYTQIPLMVIPFIGSLYGLLAYFKSHIKNVFLKKSILFISTSLLFWSLGMTSWAIYIFSLKLESVPYPSFGDLFFIFIEPFAYVGFFYLWMASNFDIKTNLISKLRLIILPIIFLISTVFLLNYLRRKYLPNGPENLLQMFFNYYYPIVTVTGIGLLSSMVIISLKTKNKVASLFILAFLTGQIFQYCGDIWYSISNITGNYFNGYWPDLFYLLSLSIASVALSNISPALTQKSK
ncbi:MAG: hypothetical protein U0525_04280 [Patescibacteria group bacterium]